MRKGSNIRCMEKVKGKVKVTGMAIVRAMVPEADRVKVMGLAITDTTNHLLIRGHEDKIHALVVYILLENIL
jgi:hypothetical protein